VLQTNNILIISFLYIGLLFGIAYWGDKRADAKRSIIGNPYIYALSLAVYCTAWTFYGSVGRAALMGPEYLPTYLGPTLVTILGWVLLRKIIRIAKTYRITSIADFIASRYGKSRILGSVVTLIAVLGIIPYISLQLKAISASFFIISHDDALFFLSHTSQIHFFEDNAFYIALLLALFSILFGTRHLDVTERHEGLVAAIAFESIVNLLAFLSVGLFVTYFVFDGFSDIIHKADTDLNLRQLFQMGKMGDNYTDWIVNMLVSMLAFILLPRQFQVAVVENVDETHLKKAMWLFPLYLLLMNLFVLPIALGGSLLFPGKVLDADTFVLTIPISKGFEFLTLLVFVGGMSAATSMVIVETVALSTMICNDLAMPFILQLSSFRSESNEDISSFLIKIRRVSIVTVVLLGYIHFHLVGESYTLVYTGMISFAAVAQFAPALIGGIFWKGATRLGALAGLLGGFLTWFYTLVVPTFCEAGFLPERLLIDGPFAVKLLAPYPLFGFKGMDPISHGIFWSLLINLSLFIALSLKGTVNPMEHKQASLFVDVFKYQDDVEKPSFWRGTGVMEDLSALLARFLGKESATKALRTYAQKEQLDLSDPKSNVKLLSHAEGLLAGVIGSASARIVVSKISKVENLSTEEAMDILEETKRAIAYSHEMERLAQKLQKANERLTELDRLKDEFITTVTHELKTPLTAIHSLSEILRDNPQLPEDQRERFVSIIIRETERFSRLISKVLDFQKIESGKMDWHVIEVDITQVIDEAIAASSHYIREKKIRLHKNLQNDLPFVPGDRDRLVQVMVNLISNAAKFCPKNDGAIRISATDQKTFVQVDVADNGIGIPLDQQTRIFQEFTQVHSKENGWPSGTGIGLTIVKRIIEFHHGKIWVTSEPQKGAIFSFTLLKTQKA
jgi:Na+/proline symporter/signal transduction histidine kinase